MITKTPGLVLQYYDPDKPLTVQVDASQNGLGAVLMQEGKPLSYASKALTPTQQAYAQIEKEALAIVFGCEKFHHIVYGRDFTVETDHKPLETILSKPLQSMPMRLQRMRLRLQWYNITVKYKPGKQIPVADTLSRYGTREKGDDNLDIDKHVEGIIKHMPVSDERMSQVKEETKTDGELQNLRKFIEKGWPETRKSVPTRVQQFWNYRDELSITDDIIFKADKIVIPKSLRTYRDTSFKQERLPRYYTKQHRVPGRSTKQLKAKASRDQRYRHARNNPNIYREKHTHAFRKGSKPTETFSGLYPAVITMRVNNEHLTSNLLFIYYYLFSCQRGRCYIVPFSKCCNARDYPVPKDTTHI
jgi:hypothetical protein